MKYLPYTRVSQRGSDWTGETSCEAQVQEIRRYVTATDSRAEFLPEIREEFVSGTTLKKRRLALVLDDAKHGRADWGVLVALDLDRLFRSTEECLASFRLLAEAQKGVILVRQNIDLASPYGRFTLTVLAAVAQLTAQIGSQKTKDKMLYIIRQGLWPCRAPYGYRRTGPRNNLLEVDPGKDEIVRAIYADALAGHGPVWIAREHGIPKNGVMNILENPFYAGRLVYGDETAQGKHEAIIPPEDWERVQRVATVKQARPDRQKYPYKLTGMVRCVCGQAMSPATCKGKGGTFAYYRCQNAACTHDARYVRADLLEKAILDEVAGYCYSDEACVRLAEHEAKHHAAVVAAESPELQRLVKALEGTRLEIDRLLGNLSGAQGGGLGGAAKAILGTLDAKQRHMEAIEQEVQTMQARLKVSMAAQDPQALASMWQETARLLAGANGDPKMQAEWLRAHVVSIESAGAGWSVKLSTEGCSTSRTIWHPKGAVVELMITLPRRAA